MAKKRTTSATIYRKAYRAELALLTPAQQNKVKRNKESLYATEFSRRVIQRAEADE